MMNRLAGMFPGVVREVGLLLALALLAAAGTKAFHPLAPAWYLQPDADEYALTLTSLRQRWDLGEVIWIDARGEAAFEGGHYPGAIRLTREEWNQLLYQHFDTLAASPGPVIVYCDGSRCAKSKEVALALRDLGIPEVYYLRGGWDELRRNLPPGS